MPTPREIIVSALAELWITDEDGPPIDDTATLESLGADSLDMIELAMVIEEALPDLPEGIFDHTVTMETTVAEIIAMVETGMVRV